jgi:hypothetical protein
VITRWLRTLPSCLILVVVWTTLHEKLRKGVDRSAGATLAMFGAGLAPCLGLGWFLGRLGAGRWRSRPLPARGFRGIIPARYVSDRFPGAHMPVFQSGTRRLAAISMGAPLIAGAAGRFRGGDPRADAAAAEVARRRARLEAGPGMTP